MGVRCEMVQIHTRCSVGELGSTPAEGAWLGNDMNRSGRPSPQPGHSRGPTRDALGSNPRGNPRWSDHDSNFGHHDPQVQPHEAAPSFGSLESLNLDRHFVTCLLPFSYDSPLMDAIPSQLNPVHTHNPHSVRYLLITFSISQSLIFTPGSLRWEDVIMLTHWERHAYKIASG